MPERLWLTYKHRGPRQLIYRAATFPLRFTPLEPLLRLNPSSPDRTAYARRWYRRHGRPVTVVIPSYRDAKLVVQLVRRTDVSPLWPQWVIKGLDDLVRSLLRGPGQPAEAAPDTEKKPAPKTPMPAKKVR